MTSAHEISNPLARPMQVGLETLSDQDLETIRNVIAHIRRECRDGLILPMVPLAGPRLRAPGSVRG